MLDAGHPLADVLDSLQHTDGDQFAEGEDGLAVVGNIRKDVVDLTEQFGEKSAMFMGFLAA